VSPYDLIYVARLDGSGEVVLLEEIEALPYLLKNVGEVVALDAWERYPNGTLARHE
jgi:hypothetical protein